MGTQQSGPANCVRPDDQAFRPGSRRFARRSDRHGRLVPARNRTPAARRGAREVGCRLAATLVWAAVLIAAVVGILTLIGVTAGNVVAAAAGLTLATVLWLPVTRRWNARAHVCWATTTYVFVVYLVFIVWWTFASHLGIAGDVGGMLLWLLELVAAGLGCAYWNRSITRTTRSRCSTTTPTTSSCGGRSRHGVGSTACSSFTRAIAPVTSRARSTTRSKTWSAIRAS
jgi:hypothetical protein